MGETQFLLGGGVPTAGSIYEAIEDLQNRSTIFVVAMAQGDMVRAGRVSEGVMQRFDHIVGDLMRSRDDLRAQLSPANPAFMASLSAQFGTVVKTKNRAHHIAVNNLGPGNGRVPPAAGTAAPATLELVLNKVKHQNRMYGNFRIDAGRHILVICADHPAGVPESVVEFDVEEFCQLCRKSASLR